MLKKLLDKRVKESACLAPRIPISSKLSSLSLDGEKQRLIAYVPKLPFDCIILLLCTYITNGHFFPPNECINLVFQSKQTKARIYFSSNIAEIYIQLENEPTTNLLQIIVRFNIRQAYLFSNLNFIKWDFRLSPPLCFPSFVLLLIYNFILFSNTKQQAIKICIFRKIKRVLFRLFIYIHIFTHDNTILYHSTINKIK